MWSTANHHLFYDLFSLKEKSTEPSLLLECDSTVKDAILKHLKVYKIRRKVSITPCPELAIWALLPVDKDSAPDKPEITDNKQDIVLERDPRTELMGWRLIVNREVKPEDIIASALEGNPEEYHKHRYTIGMFIFCILDVASPECQYFILGCTLSGNMA